MILQLPEAFYNFLQIDFYRFLIYTFIKNGGGFMKSSSIYYNAQIIAAAIRLIDHKNSTPPGIDEICVLTGFSAEHSGFICKKMIDVGAISSVDTPDGPRYFIDNHLRLEDLPKEEASDKMNEEIQKFKSRKDDLSKKVEEFQEKQKKKQQELFAKLNSELKIKNGIK